MVNICEPSFVLVRDKVLIASKFVANLGDAAVAKMEAMVDAHMEADDMEGAAFWREIADAVRVVARRGRANIH